MSPSSPHSTLEVTLMTLLCVTLQVFLCAFTAYFTDIFTHAPLRVWPVRISHTWHQGELSEWRCQLCFIHLNCCTVSVAPWSIWSFPYWGTFRLSQTKPPIHSYLLPCTYEQVPVLRMGFLSQGEEKCWYSLCEPPSTASPGLPYRVRADVTYQPPYLRQCWGAFVIIITFL